MAFRNKTPSGGGGGGGDAATLDGFDSADFVRFVEHTKALHDALLIDADTVDGSHAAAFAGSGHDHDATYSALAHNHDAAYSALAHSHVETFHRGGTYIDTAGITGAINSIVWRAPFSCTVTNVRGYRVGGTGATINARRNGADNHLAAALSLVAADAWADGGAVQNTAYVAGDKLEIMLVSAAGSPTQLAVQVDYTRP